MWIIFSWKYHILCKNTPDYKPSKKNYSISYIQAKKSREKSDILLMTEIFWFWGEEHFHLAQLVSANYVMVVGFIPRWAIHLRAGLMIFLSSA